MHEDEKTLAEVVRQGRGCRYFYQSPALARLSLVRLRPRRAQLCFAEQEPR
jgi:hypothetical protein